VKKPILSTDSITSIETATTSMENNSDSYLFRSLTNRVCYSLFLIASWCRVDCVICQFVCLWSVSV